MTENERAPYVELGELVESFHVDGMARLNICIFKSG